MGQALKQIIRWVPASRINEACPIFYGDFKDESFRTARLLSISSDGNESIKSSRIAVIVLSLLAAYSLNLFNLRSLILTSNLFLPTSLFIGCTFVLL